MVIVLVADPARSAWRPSGRSAWALPAGVPQRARHRVLPVRDARGLLSITSVVTSLYPAFTVVLAATVLREHVHRAQAAGLLLCAVAVTMVAAG